MSDAMVSPWDGLPDGQVTLIRGAYGFTGTTDNYGFPVGVDVVAIYKDAAATIAAFTPEQKVAAEAFQARSEGTLPVTPPEVVTPPDVPTPTPVVPAPATVVVDTTELHGWHKVLSEIEAVPRYVLDALERLLHLK